MSPLTLRRLRNFKANRRGSWSLAIFLVLFALSLCAELIANDRPIVISLDGTLYVPVLVDYAETDLGGEFPTDADYRDPYLLDRIAESGWAVWPLIRFDHATVNFETPVPAPSPPTADNWLGTDDQGRDVAARMIYGFRISILFGLLLTGFSSVLGIAAGAVQGYFGGKLDLIFQRVLEVWGGMPQLLVLIIVASVITPGFWTLLIVLMLFSWTSLVGVVRAEFLRARNFDYVRAAKALGMGDGQIMVKHVLPNAMVATMTFTPFILSGSVVALTSLDFLGLGLPAGSASLGDVLRQGKENLQAPWLGLTGFCVVAVMLTLLVFIGEAVRDAFDPRKNVS
ncbi:MAG: ABC transporter permease [Alphaproteobacteria bacterium RIFOXYD12_FULL_60_8]|nr:MAG: ABC transporter permease [Alphaproteobacteria bacterium RIFOXYD12_FULL_60_8]